MAIAGSFGLALPAVAQQGPGQWTPTPSTQVQTRGASPRGQPLPPPGTAANEPAGAPQAAAGDAGLRQRVEQLEGQLIDLQVVVGTLESLAKSGGQGGAASSGPGPGMGGSFGDDDSGRLAAMETQIRALTGQLEQLAEQVRALGGQPRRSDAGGFADEPVAGPGPGSGPGGIRTGRWDDEQPPTAVTRFGSTTVTADRPDAMDAPMPGRGPAAEPAQGTAVAAAPLPEAGAGNPKQLYETAYGYLLQQDYAAAEAAFDDFLKRYPNDSLAGNAQYWLGEAHFVRGQYKAAASAFLKGYTTYARSSKAPDSLLKLAMSLDRLGQKEAACSSYGELINRFPNAPPHLKSRADSERRRVGCP